MYDKLIEKLNGFLEDGTITNFNQNLREVPMLDYASFSYTTNGVNTSISLYVNGSEIQVWDDSSGQSLDDDVDVAIDQLTALLRGNITNIIQVALMVYGKGEE